MKKEIKELESFEQIFEAQGKIMTGGFSASFTNTSIVSFSAEAANNCKGGNCTANCACNTKSGCGTL
jgi:hypothetical protein